MSQHIEMYTDGACSPNPGSGGWATIIHLYNDNNFDTEIVLSGAEPDTTNNRMELKAALEGLIVISKPTIITIFTDSRYLQQGVGTWEKGTAIRGWMNKWKSNGWQKKDGPLLNSDLWRQMYDKVTKHTRIMTKYVPGHKGHVLNERCDKLAKQALERLVQKNEQDQI